MNTLTRSLAVVSLVVGFFAATSGHGGGRCCSHCGSEAPCQKVCRLVKEEKKIETVCWGCKCEDFCLPGPSHIRCRHCETVCSDGECVVDKDGVAAKPKDWVWTEWLPSCKAHLHTKKKLMKKVVTKKVPAYKWVVEDLCTKCEAGAAVADFEPDHAIPLPPPGDAKLLYGRAAATVELR
jgi:hypothetical protein